MEHEQDSDSRSVWEFLKLVIPELLLSLLLCGSILTLLSLMWCLNSVAEETAALRQEVDYDRRLINRDRDRIVSLERTDQSLATEASVSKVSASTKDLEKRVAELEAVSGLVCEEFARAHPVPPDFNWRTGLKPRYATNDGDLPVPASIDAFATEALLRDVVTEITLLAAPFNGGNWDAREKTFDLLAKQAGLSFVEEFDQYSEWSTAVLEVARVHFRDPSRLWATYQAFKPVAVEVVKASRDYTLVKGTLTAAAEIFTSPPDPALIELSRRESEASRTAKYLYRVENGRACAIYFQGKSADLTDDLLNDDRLAGYDKVAMFQWMLRRQDEGGRALVLTWGSIFSDLARSIPDQPAATDAAPQ